VHPVPARVRLFGFSGSPRLAATDFAVREALRYAEERYPVETRYFSFHGKRVNFCIHCDYCIRTRQGCVHKDDLIEAYDGLLWADAWIIGTPVYQGTLSGQTKVMMDRCRALLARDPQAFRGKIGAAIAVGGDRVGGQEPAIQTILNFYVISEVIPVGGGSFGANLGGCLWSRDRGAEGASDDTEGLKSLHRTMDRLITAAQKYI